MAILWEPDGQTAAVLRPALPEPVTVADTVAAVRSRAGDSDDDVVVAGPGADLATVLQYAAAERVTSPARGVILVRQRFDGALLAQAMRAGIREVVKAEDVAALGDACHRSIQLSKQVRGVPVNGSAATNGRVVTVFSGKGGCGKTTVATNLAVALARGKPARRVCLVDLDLAFGDVGVALLLEPRRTLADVVGLSRLDVTAVHSLVTPHSSGVDVLLAPVDPTAGERLAAAVITDLLTVLRSLYDDVVVDSPPAFNEQVLAAFDVTDQFVLVGTLDMPALKNLKLTLETLAMLGIPEDRWQVLLNRADAKVGLTPADVESTLGRSLVGRIPSSRAVPAAVNRGVPITLDAPGHPVSAAFHKLAETLRPTPPPAPARRIGLRVLRRAEVAS